MSTLSQAHRARLFSPFPLAVGGMLLCLLLVAALALYQQRPPQVVPASAPATTFSAERAMEHLAIIAQAPHPIGSAEHAALIDYLMQSLRDQGLSPEIQEQSAVQLRARVPHRVGRPRNIVARLEGTGEGKAILLMGHYDSVPNSYGASDDGAALAAMLETLRALQAGPALERDVIFLFTDAEETGLLGARAFVDEHPWMDEVGLVLNFEARGSGGPSLMFETSQDNQWLIEGFAAAAPHPRATSLSYEIYKLLPNDTDLTLFKEAGAAALNFSYLDRFTHYHSALDNIEEIDPRSLQHHGSYALALVRHFGMQPLESTPPGDAVYFDLLGSTVVHYSTRWVLPLSALVTLLTLAVLGYGLRQKTLTVRGILAGTLLLLLSAIAVGGGITLLWWLINQLHPGYRLIPQGDTYNSPLYMAAFTLLALALLTLLYGWYQERVAPQKLIAGGLLLWLLLLLASSILIPGASYLFTWPLLIGLLAWGILLGRAWPPRTLGTLALLLVGALPALLLLSPVVHQLFVALSLSLAGAVMGVMVLLAVPLLPHLLLVGSLHRWALPALFSAAGLALLLVASLNAGFDAAKPQPNSLVYAVEPAREEALWVSADARPDAWTSQFLNEPAQGALPAFLPYGTRRYLSSVAPLLKLEAPAITLLEESVQGTSRTLRLRLSSPRQAPLLSFYVSPTVSVTGAVVDGQPLEPVQPPKRGDEEWWGVTYYGLPASGIEVTLTVEGAGPFQLKVVDQSYGLPVDPALAYEPRPATMMPHPFVLTDATLVATTMEIEP